MALQGKRIFITGGAGFIATTLARTLVDENEIVAVDNLHRDALSGTPLAGHPNFTLHKGDILDAPLLVELAQGATHFVHCAAIAGVDTVLASPVRTMRVNVIGTYNALEAATATLDTLERFVDFSTSEVFGTHAFRVSEGQVSTIGSVGEARWTYAVSKLAGEHMAHAYHDELGLPTVTVHPLNVFGPGQIGGGAIRAFIEAALDGRDLTIHGDGSQIRAWCYVSDMVSGVLACLERPEAVGQAYNIGNPRSSVTIFDLAQRIKRLANAPGEVVFTPLTYADVELRIPNVEKAYEQLGWAPQVELDDGLERTIEWFREEQARIRLAWPDVGQEELDAVAAVLESGMLTMGSLVGEFEEGLARACETEHAIAVSSGTAALHLAVLALDLQPGDEIVVPAYTFPATANVVALAGLKPVLVDVDPETMNIDPAKIEVGPRTKAILPVHLFGRPARMEELPDLPLIEDAAGALGARRGGKACGSLGLMACLSFHPRKIVTTGEGGAITTNDERVADACRQLRNHGWRSLADADMPAPGLNYRLSDILCAVGIPQLRRLDELFATRTRIAAGYSERLAELPVLVPRADEGDVHGWQAYVIQVERRDEVLASLRAQGIEAQIGTFALPLLGAYRDQGFFPGAEHAFEHALALPFHSRLTESDLDRVVDALDKLVSHH